MIMDKIKITNPQDFWCSYEAERAIYYSIKWNIGEDSNKLLVNQKEFISAFFNLCLEFHLLVPQEMLNSSDGLLDWPIARDLAEFKTQFLKFYYPERKDKGLFNSLIYFGEDHSAWIVNIDPIVKMEETNRFDEITCPPVKIDFYLDSIGSTIDLNVSFDHDAFFSEVDNPKTSQAHSVFPNNSWLDNEVSNRLNGERLYNFVSRLKRVCFEFDASNFSVDSSFSEFEVSDDGRIV